MRCSIIYYYFVSMRLLIYERHINYLKYITSSPTYLLNYLLTRLCSPMWIKRLVYINKQAENVRIFRPGICSKSNKQLLDEVFVISGIINVEVSVISLSLRARLITLTETLIISDITKIEFNNCCIIHCFKENSDKRMIVPNRVYFRQAMFLLRCT